MWLLAALGAQLRLTTNMLDGMVALVSGRAAKLGELVFQAGIRDACRGNKCSGCALRSYWNF
ncbi:MAG TPA: hypothetical protein VGI59_06035 [Candidatus Udaeobacter sp.]